MHLVVVGLNHRTAPVEIRERLAVSEGNLPEALETLSACHCVAECCILSTCNRTEVYAVTDRHEDEETLIEFLSQYHGVPRASFEDHIYRHRGHKAVQHIFTVAAGLDSMMLGENQIMCQVKDAFCIADESDSTKAILNTLFQQALSAGKRARTETDISRGAFSIGYAAVDLARSIFGGLKGHTILILGAGKMSELTARHMLANGATNVVVANRTLARAQDLAANLGGRAVPWEAFPEEMSRADVVIGSTGAQEPVVKREQMEKVMRVRRERPIFIIDIAVPRDVEASVGDLDNVFLYDIDDLEQLVEQSVAERQKEVERVREIVREETQKFTTWLRSLEAVPLIKLLRQKLDGMRDTEWERSASRLAHLSQKDQETVQAMMQSLINRVSHNPLLKMKEYAANGNGYDKLETARELFGIEALEIEESADGDRQSAPGGQPPHGDPENKE